METTYQVPVVVEISLYHKKRGRPRKNDPTWSRWTTTTIAKKVIHMITAEDGMVIERALT